MRVFNVKGTVTYSYAAARDVEHLLYTFNGESIYRRTSAKKGKI
jgi:hypothetical protein